MGRTLRGIVQLGAVLGAVLALVSWEAGRRAEAELRARVEALDAGSPIAATVARYDRGIFRSVAVVTLEESRPVHAEEPGAGLPGEPGAGLPGEPGAGLPGEPEGALADEAGPRIRTRHEIDHGPFPLSWLRDEDFDRRPVLARIVSTAALERGTAGEGSPLTLPLVLTTRLGGDGRAALRISADAERVAGTPGLSGDWDGLRAELHFRDDGSELAGELAVPRLAFREGEGAFALHDLSYAFDYARVSEAGPLYVGEGRFFLGLLRVEAGGEAFELRGLELRDGSAADGPTWSLQVDAGFDRLRHGGRTSGPGELALRMTGLALEPFAELAALGRRLESEAAAGEAAAAEAMFAVGALWPKLMEAGPSLEIPRLRLVTAEGELRGAARLGVDTSEALLLAHPLTTVPALELDAELSLPRGLLHRWLATPRPVAERGADAEAWVAPAELASRRVATWLERGHLQRHEDSYVLAVRVRKGAVRLNGRVVALDEL